MKNFFKITSAEIVQDIFFTWLLYLYDSEKEELKECSYKFINLLIDSKSNIIPNKLIVKRQYKVSKCRYDLLVIFYFNQDAYVILIEDKCNASLNNNLHEYKKELEGVIEKLVTEKYNILHRCYICIKLGGKFNACEIKKMQEANFKYLCKESFKFLSDYCKYSDIISDFYESKILNCNNNTKFIGSNKIVLNDFFENYNNDIKKEVTDKKIIFSLKKIKMSFEVVSYSHTGYKVRLFGYIQVNKKLEFKLFKSMKYMDRFAKEREDNKPKINTYGDLKNVLEKFLNEAREIDEQIRTNKC